MSYICLKRDKEFDKPQPQRVSWAGDTLKACPVCYMSVWDRHWDETHKKKEETKNTES